MMLDSAERNAAPTREQGGPLNSRPSLWRQRFYVHKIQKTYAIWLGLFLFVYSLIVFGLAFFLPYLIPAVKLLMPYTLEERTVAAEQVLALGQAFWPAIAALIVAAAVFSIYLTHRLAGPLYRLEQSARELIQGNLSLRIRLRERDELHELAGLLNEALANLDQSLVEIRDRETSGREAIRRALTELQPQPSVNHAAMERLELALKEGERINEVCKRFRLSAPQ